MTCSTRFGRLLQTSCLGLIGTLAVVGCGGSDTTKRDGGPGGASGEVGPTQGAVKVDQAVLNFGPIDVGATSAPKTVTVTVSVAPVALNATVVGEGFAISASTCGSLQPVGSCTISVVFAPAKQGAASGSLNVGTAQVALSGTGTQPGVFTATPELVPLGTVLVGASLPVTVNIIPTGTLPSLSCLPSGADLALATQTCPTAGPVSAQCSYTFTFVAQAAGDKNEAIVCNAGGTTRTVTVTAKVVTPANLSINPASQAFTAKVGQPVSWIFNVTNNGGAQTGTLTTAITGAGFAISSNECPAQLAGNANCKIQVTFAPAAAGAVTGALTVTDATPGSKAATAALTGTGIISNVTITPAAKDFATVEVGKTATFAFTMANTGTSATGIVALGSSDPQFAVVNDLCSGRALDTKEQCIFGVAFAPAVDGLVQANLNAIQTSDSAVLATASLTGTGKLIIPARLSVLPPTLDFGTTGVGVPVGPKVFTITNGGGTATGTLTVLKNDSTSSVGGASQFNITGNTCTAALAPGASCEIAVTFAPTITRSASAVISISDGSVSTANGTVVGIALAIPPLSVTCPDFSTDGTVVGDTESVVCTVRNEQPTSGETPQESGLITITAASDAATQGTFAVGTNNCTASLQPNTSCTFALVFTPLLKGTTTGTVAISSTNKGANNQTISALGLLAVEIVERVATEVTPGNPRGVVTNYDFGQVSLGANATTALTLEVYVRRNVGNINLSGTDIQWPEDTTAPASFVTDGGCPKVSGTAPTAQKSTPFCTMQIVFNPKGKGEKTNTVTAQSADGASSDTAAMRGTGTGPITLAPARMTFAAVAVGSSSATPLTLTVCNNAPNPATGAKLTITGANAADFAMVEDTVSNQTLAASGSPCKYVRLLLNIPAGAATGPRAATVTVTGTIAGTIETGTAELFGSAVAGAGLDAVLDGTFADTPVTRTSAPVTVTVTNTGSAQTDVIEFDIPNAAGSTYSDFTYEPPTGQAQATCTIDPAQTRLDPGASCQLKVWFKPTTGLGVDVQRTASLVVFSKVGGRKVVPLTAKATPQLTIAPAAQVLDPARIGGVADAAPLKTFTITNHGAEAAPLTLSFRNDTNQTGAGQFVRVLRTGDPATNGDCPASIPAWGAANNSNTCFVDVRLIPVGLPGIRTATVDADTAGTQRASATVTGFGVTGPQLLFTGDATVSISPSTVDRDFGSIMQGQTSTPQSFTLTNVGGQQAGKITVKLFNLTTHTGDEAVEVIDTEHAKRSDFVLTGACVSDTDTAVLGPGQSCSFQVAYHPTACETPGTTCPYTTTTTDVKIMVFTAGNQGTPAAGLTGAKLFGQNGGAENGSVYVVGPGYVGAYDFGLTSSATAKSAVFTLVNKSTAAFTMPSSATFANTTVTAMTVVSGNPANPQEVRAGAGEFAIDDGPASAANRCVLGDTEVGANGTCLFTVTWTPASATAYGTREVSMTVGTAEPTNLFGRVALPASLLVVPAPYAQSAAPVDFGHAVIGVNSAETRTLTIRNVGEAETGAIKVANNVAGLDPQSGQVVVASGTTCTGSGSNVAPGATCIVNVVVHPTSTDAEDWLDPPVKALDIVPLTGTATSFMRVSPMYVGWEAIHGATLEPSVATIAFDRTEVLSNGQSKVVTLTNPGNSAPTGPLTFRTDAADFAIDLDPAHSTCLAPGEIFYEGLKPTIVLNGTGTAKSCTVTVVFSPVSLATPAKTGNLIVDSASGATVTIGLSGTAIPALSVTGASPSAGFTAATATAMAAMVYSPTSITSPGTNVTFTVAKAAGSPPTGLLSTSIGGDASATPDQFRIVTDTCIGVSLTDDDPTCQVTVRFAPTSTGLNKNAVLTVMDPISGTPADSVSVALSGRADE